MTTPAFLHDLEARGIEISLNGDRLVCRAAEGVLTETLRAEIAARKPEIVALLRQLSADQGLTLEPAPRGVPAPLSFAQQRLWFLHQLNPEDPAYNIGFTLTLEGPPDVPAARRAIEALVRRHDILRTVFVETDGVPAQVVTDVLPAVSVLEPDADPATRARLIEEVVQRPFDLAARPPVRVALFAEAEGCRLVVGIHHILADGWSLGNFVRQLEELYRMARQGEPAAVPMPWQYADFAHSQRRWYDRTSHQADREFWRQKLKGIRPGLDLPVDHPRGRALTPRGGAEKFVLPAPLVGRLRAVSRESGATVFAALLALYEILLHHYSGQTDIVVGTPVANRSQVELESLIGMFVSTVVLRTDLSGNPTFREVLARVRDTLLEAHEHQDYPFEQVVELLRPDRSLTRSPLFQTAFALLNTPASRSYQTIPTGAPFELSLYLWEGGEDLPGSFEYDANLFDPATITRMIGHYRTLAEAAVANPDLPIARLPILTPDERTQLLETWNRTETSYPRDRSVPALFEAQVDATPNATAVVVPSGPPVRLSYRELDERANRLAHYLRAAGVAAGAPVGIALNRSADFVIAALAVLKLGGAYVPVDPALPPERLAVMVGDAQASIVLTRSEFLAQLPDVGFTIVCLDRETEALARQPTARIGDAPAPLDLAYVMYTSGSTGRPKGVGVPHRAIVRLVKNTNYATLTEQDVVLGCAAVSFDASTFELWGSLLNGARLVLYPELLPEPEELARLIREQHVTTLWLTAGLFHLMVETDVECFANVRQLLAGGDVVSPAHARKALRVLRGGVLINGYGPTENTTFTCCHRMSREAEVGDTVPIGRPIANTRVYVLDPNRQPVPIGVPGELWAAGDGLALGYRNDPALTAERFVPDPFAADPEARMYRTGDLVRFRADGVLEFLGRADRQVKLRGFRIELAEIEQVLRGHAAVRDVVVVVRERSPGNKQLIAYCIGAKGRELDPADLKRLAQQRLPEYAVPSLYFPIEAFPLTPNGKVDLAALPDPGALVEQRVAPRTELERQLVAVWERVLDVQGIGVNDNFFELGGSSLLGIRLLAALQDVVGRRVPVSVLFRGQTVEAMAAVLGEAAALENTSRAVAIQPGGARTPLFIVPGVNGNVIGYEALAQALGPDQPVYGLRSVGLEGEAEPLDRVEDIAAVFEADLRVVQPHGPYRILGFCMGGIVAYEVAQQLVARGETVELLGLIDTWPPALIPAKLGTSRLGQQVAFLAQGVVRHLKTLRQQPITSWLGHLRRKVRVLSEMVEKRDVYRGDHYDRYRDLVARLNQTAAASYVPAPYPGDVTLLLSGRTVTSDDDPRLSWSGLAQGATSVLVVEGKDSGSLLSDPYVQGFANTVREWLHESPAAATVDAS